MELIASVLRHENEVVKHWAEHKKHILIASGLNKHCLMTDPSPFDQFILNTNAVEQTHMKSYSIGIYRFSFRAVKRVISCLH